MSIGKIELRENKKEYVKYANIGGSGGGTGIQPEDFIGTQQELLEAIAAGTTYEGMTAFVDDETEEENPDNPSGGSVGNVDDRTATFTEAVERENIESGETYKTILGKIRKWFADTRTAAFCSVVNNLTTEEEGSLLDARQGKVLADKVDEVDIALNATNFDFKLKKYVDTECSSHIEVLQKHWNEAFEGVPTAGGYRIILTNYGSSNVVWTCYAYHNKLYGYAACFAHPNNDITNPQYCTINNGNWTTSVELINDNNLYKKSIVLAGGISLPSNANLNAYKTPGNYYCNSNTVAPTLVNCPVNEAFKMIVDYATGYGYPRQIIIPYKNNGIYTRSVDDNGDWSGWNRFITDKEILKYKDTAVANVSIPSGTYWKKIFDTSTLGIVGKFVSVKGWDGATNPFQVCGSNEIFVLAPGGTTIANIYMRIWY